jgi:uncharacterized membrane protein
MSDPVIASKRQPSVLLIVSLCLNLALIGLVAITFMRTGMRHFEPREEKIGLSAQSLMRMIPAEEDKIRAIVDAHHKLMRPLRQQAKRARAESFQLLEAKDFNADAFAKSLSDVQNADAALESETMKLTAESIAALTPQERETVAGKVQKPDRAELRRLFPRH